MTPNSIIFSDPTIWLVFSFVAFVVLAFVFGRQSVMGILDAKIEKIRNDIASAENLRNEAEAMLSTYQFHMRNASVEADRIIAKAKIQADDIRKQADKDLEETMARRESMLKTRIEQMERSAMDDIRRYAAELAVSATSEIISQKLSSQSANSLADESINRISEKLN